LPEGDRALRTAAFGRWLVQQRELRGLEREELVRLGRLPPGVVEALESGDASRMPARAYVLGTLRSYAAAAGLDADDVALRWQEIQGAEEAPRPGAGRGLRRWAWAAALAVLAALAGLAAAGWLWSRRR